jgi:hypothetical protein
MTEVTMHLDEPVRLIELAIDAGFDDGEDCAALAMAQVQYINGDTVMGCLLRCLASALLDCDEWQEEKDHCEWMGMPQGARIAEIRQEQARRRASKHLASIKMLVRE